MKVGFYIITFNRPKIASYGIQTLCDNAGRKPDEIWVIDDGSEPEMRNSLFQSSYNGVNLLVHASNKGIGYTFERVYNLIDQDDELDIACIIESDYVWRQHWLKECLAVFEASPHTIAIAGSDHPDMYDKAKTHGSFIDIMKECFGEDVKAREHLYKPFDLQTELGKVKVQGVSNSCGCMIIHWKRFRNILNTFDLTLDFWARMDRAFNKGVTHDTRKNASDGHMSTLFAMYGEKEVIRSKASLEQNFPILSICDYSISEHVCGGGVNATIAPEGSTFIQSPTWNKDYLSKNPRE